MTEPRIRLTTRGDDLGTNHSANVAITEALKKVILRNASVTVPCPAIKEAAEMLAEEKDICVGLHSTVNAEWDSVRWGPVLPPEKVPSVVDRNGHLFQTVRALRENGPDIDHVFMELQAQLDRARALGFDVKYVDRHMGWSRAIEGIDETFDNPLFHDLFEDLPRLLSDGTVAVPCAPGLGVTLNEEACEEHAVSTETIV